MKDNKKHLDINLEFLDKKDSPVIPLKSFGIGKTNTTNKKNHNWKKVLVVLGILFFVGMIILSDDGENSGLSADTYTSPVQSSSYKNNDDSVEIGEYTCSSYNYDQAMAINPNDSEQKIDNTRASLEYRVSQLEQLRDKIDNSDVNDYSEQWEIDQYNETIEEYNSKLSSYNLDSANFDTEINHYNNQVQEYNDYLDANCIKKY